MVINNQPLVVLGEPRFDYRNGLCLHMQQLVKHVRSLPASVWLNREKVVFASDVIVGIILIQLWVRACISVRKVVVAAANRSIL